MKKAASLLSTCLLLFGCFLAEKKLAIAQIVPDSTTSTTVTPTSTGVEINNGNAAGSNLFHSFSEFSIPAGTEAFFNNADNVSNIFSRVTGGNISNIDGLIRANGTANLFLINPAGIVFGEGARLQVGGSFYGSTADSIVFGDGEFSAIDLDSPPLITINAPIGLNFRNDPAAITVRGNGNGTRFIDSPIIDTQEALRVGSNATIGLIGGELIFENATVKTAGGRIELGSVAGGSVEIVEVAEGLSFGYDQIDTFQDISLLGISVIDASGEGGGAINIAGNNLSLVGVSEIASNTIGSNPGKGINIFTAESISLGVIESEFSFNIIDTRTFPQGTGDSGDINITTGTLTIGDRSFISSFLEGQGNAGDIRIDATERISLFSEGNISSISSGIGSQAVGNAGNVEIVTPTLELANGAFIASNTAGIGNAGDISVRVSGTLTAEGEGSSLLANVRNAETVGDGGNIDITADSILLRNGAGVDVSSNGEGNAGNVNLEVRSLAIENSSLILASSTSQSKGGNITIDALEDISLSGSSAISVTGSGDGSIEINARNLTVSSGSNLFAGIFPDAGSTEAQAGDIRIDLVQDLTIDEDNADFATAIVNSNDGTGNAGNIFINARNLNFLNGGRIFNFTSGQGDIGDITIEARGDINFEGIGSGQSGVSNFVEEGSTGNVGAIAISGNNLRVADGAVISSFVSGTGNSGEVRIDIADTIVVSGFAEDSFSSSISSIISDRGIGNSGAIDIETNNLFLARNGVITTLVRGIGNSGNINITAEKITIGEQGTTTLSPSSIRSQIFNQFGSTNDISIDEETVQAGDININTDLLLIKDGGIISSGIARESIGNGGDIRINAKDSIAISGVRDFNGEEIASQISSDILRGAIGNSGDIEIATPNLTLSNSAFISTDILGRGNSGNIVVATDRLKLSEEATISASISRGSSGNAGSLDITATDSIDMSNGRIRADIFQNAEGRGGNLNIQTANLTVTNGSQIRTSTSGAGDAGSLDIRATDSILLSGTSDVARGGLFANAIIEDGNGGDLRVFTDLLILRDGATIQASNFQSLGQDRPGSGNSGDININAELIVAFPNQNSDIVANALQGDGGNININAEGVFGLEERASQPANRTNDIDASSQFGLSGTVNVRALDNDSLQETAELSNDVFTAEILTASSACRASNSDDSGLVVKGKGGIEPQLTEPFDGEALIVQEESMPAVSNRDSVSNSQVPSNVKPVTYNGEGKPVYIARGIIQNPDGSITLTPYPINGNEARRSDRSLECN